MYKQAFSKKLTRTGDDESAIKYVWQQKWTLWRNICIIKIIQRLIVRGSTTYTRLLRPSMPMPRKSVLGSSPWNPVKIISIHILFLKVKMKLPSSCSLFIIWYLSIAIVLWPSFPGGCQAWVGSKAGEVPFHVRDFHHWMART